MQTLYALESGDQAYSPEELVKILQKHFTQTRQLFVYLIYFITELALYAETDSRVRLGKHLPTDADRNINTKLAGNDLVQRILLDPSFQKAIKADKPQLLNNADLVRKIYNELVETDEYKKYILINERDKRSEKEIIEFIFSNILLVSETFEAYVEDSFTNWSDDLDLMIQLLPGYFSKPQSVDLQEILSKEKWDFAKNLVLSVQEKKELTMELIKPKLKNWDADRIAVLDMILMRMGVCEFLFFDTIPP